MIGPEGAGGGLLRHGSSGRGVSGDGGGPGRLGSGAVHVQAGAGQSTEGDDEEQHQDEERGEQHELGGDAARLVASQSARPAMWTRGHGGPPASVVYCSVGPVATARTGKEKRPMMLSACPVTVTVVTSTPRWR